MHTAEGTVIDVSALRARRPWRPSALSTPAGLKVAMVATAIAVALFGIVGVRAAIDRRAAADDVVAQAGPLLIDAQDLYVALAGADAAASTSFLRAGLEPPELRQRYLEDLDRAGEGLAAVAGADLGPGAAAAAETLARELPIYAGMVEAARTNSRLEFLGRRRLPAPGLGADADEDPAGGDDDLRGSRRRARRPLHRRHGAVGAPDPSP